jgi:hypothetical protein
VGAPNVPSAEKLLSGRARRWKDARGQQRREMISTTKPVAMSMMK